ncbi:Cytochrome oxidase assembly [Lobaria immixta]|nr:Cytochrome oxidase assembly [Lobaria immixta]
MPTFQSKKFRPASYQNTWAAAYRRALARHPFLLFGLPFISTMVAGSFLLTPATALRYERHDRKVRQMTKEEELGIGKDRRKVDINEEYYRLAAKDLDDWENKRVKRLKGEPDGVL